MHVLNYMHVGVCTVMRGVTDLFIATLNTIAECSEANKHIVMSPSVFFFMWTRMGVVTLTGNKTRHTTISVGSQRRSRAKAKAVEQPKLYGGETPLHKQGQLTVWTASRGREATTIRNGATSV